MFALSRTHYKAVHLMSSLWLSCFWLSCFWLSCFWLSCFWLVPGGATRAIAQSGQKKQLQNAEERDLKPERRVALVIGNAKYKRGKLTNPGNDADDMAAFLKRVGFEVTEEKDLPKNEMERAVKKFGEDIKGASVALFYYSGHGVQAKGINYLVPIDQEIKSEADIPDKALRLSLVFEQLEAAKTGVNLVFLDACRNNPFEQGSKTVGEQGLAEVSAPKGTLIAFAAAPGKTASDNPEKRNGLWTQEFLNATQKPGVELSEALAAAGKEVEKLSILKDKDDEQVPWLNSSLREKIYFGVRPDEGKNDGKDNGKDNGKDTKKNTEKYMGKVYTVEGIEFIPIPEGPFEMGDDDLPDNPRHMVTLHAYSISKYPVTVNQYMQFVQYKKSHDKQYEGPKQPAWGWIDNHPIVNVSWGDAMAYCEWLSTKTGLKITLPTEAQWEKAARGPKGFKFPWGNQFYRDRLQHSSIQDGDAGRTAEVGKFPEGASPYGVLDMAGNVFQWCRDWYDAGFTRMGQQVDPMGPEGGIQRVLRGGSWFYTEDTPYFRSSYRNNSIPTRVDSQYGFRVVLEP